MIIARYEPLRMSPPPLRFNLFTIFRVSNAVKKINLQKNVNNLSNNGCIFWSFQLSHGLYQQMGALILSHPAVDIHCCIKCILIHRWIQSQINALFSPVLLKNWCSQLFNKPHNLFFFFSKQKKLYVDCYVFKGSWLQ